MNIRRSSSPTFFRGPCCSSCSFLFCAFVLFDFAWWHVFMSLRCPFLISPSDFSYIYSRLHDNCWLVNVAVYYHFCFLLPFFSRWPSSSDGRLLIRGLPGLRRWIVGGAGTLSGIVHLFCCGIEEGNLRSKNCPFGDPQGFIRWCVVVNEWKSVENK